MRFAIPSPYEEIAHTADVGVAACGASPEEAYARAALGMAQLQAGGGLVEQRETRRLVARGEDRASLLVDLCRQVLDLFFRERLLLSAIALHRLTETGLEAEGVFGPFDPETHAEGMDIKAVTYARAAVEREASGRWRASVIFDI